MDSRQYELTAANLRVAAVIANDEPISADNLLSHVVVWEHCAEHIDDYLVLVDTDENTSASCSDPEVLVSVIDIQHEVWLPEQLEAFLDASAGSASLPDITAVEQSTWKAVVEASLMVPNISNLQAYVTEIDVDDALGQLLADDADGVVEISGLENANEEQLGTLVLRLLSADGMLAPRQRVLLAKQLLAAPTAPSFDFSAIETRPDTLLAEMLRERLVPDSEEVFAHFSSAGWDSIGPGLLVSANASAFLTPTLVAGHAADLVGDSQVPVSTRREVLDRLPEFAAVENSTFLITAASAARDMGVQLSTEALMIVAPSVQNYEDVVWQLHEHGTAIDTVTVLQVLGLMSGDFAGFAGSSGQEFEVSDTPSLESVLTRLKTARVLGFQRGRQPIGRWKLRIP